jgi:hypothetical protein
LQWKHFHKVKRGIGAARGWLHRAGVRPTRHRFSGGANCIKSGGTGDIAPEAPNQDISPKTTCAVPSADEIAARIASALSDFTIVTNCVEVSSASARITLWGKDVRSNPAIFRAWFALSHFVMITLNTLDGVEFIEAFWSNEI